MSKHLKFLVFFTIAFCSSSYIDVITTNDIHGFIDKQNASYITSYPPTIIIGGSGFHQYVNDVKEDTDDKMLILDAGNFFQGHPVGIIDSGRTMIEWMNMVGYNAMVPGNYDFIFGIDNLVNLSKKAEFPFLAANLFYKDSDELVFPPYEIFQLDDVKVAVFGIVNPNLFDIVLHQNLINMILKDPISTMNKMSLELRTKADIIIMLTSAGVPWDREEVYDDFIKKVKENNYDKNGLNAIEIGYFSENIDVIISGGISKGYYKPWYDPNSHVYTFQNYGGGTSFGHFLLKYDSADQLFAGYKSAVKNNYSQSLFLDDFSRFDENIYNWISGKSSNAIEQVYSDINWDEEIYSDSYISFSNDSSLTNKWDIPNINVENNLDIITWNCEFFPTANDSTIDALSEAITDLNVDIIAFQEIKKRGWFGKLMLKLDEYDYVISQQSSFMDQAIIYKKDEFSLVNRLELFAENDYNFAGRPPLMTSFVHNDSNTKFSVINLHMKCCDPGLERRKKASLMLYDYLVSELNENNLIVLGDWNDDLKDAEGQHCFKPFLDNDDFYFPTYDIAYDISKASYPKEPYVSFLDHILVSENFVKKDKYFVDTIPIDKYMGGFDIYEAYISDHMPIYLSFPY